eukprot:gb/GEZN01005642.1/.p1 GENE.gb/GEZN01005642.1/~~gb/GEZN01005642.1/.p1  ORF type:complete len:512 (+),score=41.84 gb/GEZN01005642.1/:132-1667(+)
MTANPWQLKDKWRRVGLVNSSQPLVDDTYPDNCEEISRIASSLPNNESSKAPSWKGLLLAGGIFCVDAYDLFIINLVMKIMAKNYPQTTTQTAILGSVALAGAMIGQLLFGILGDLFGRKKTFLVTVTLVISSTLLSGLCFDSPHVSIYTQLAVWRFFLGLGIGGEYPLSATTGGENVSASERGRQISKVFSMQGVGSISAALIILILLHAEAPSEFIWRFSLMITALPASYVSYLRYHATETARFQKMVRQRNPDERRWVRFAALTERDAFLTLLGTAGSWLIFDISFYGNSIFNATITEAMGLGGSLKDEALNSTILALMALPGYILTIYTTTCITRKSLQMMGFLVLALLFLLLGFDTEAMEKCPTLMITLYGLTYVFSNWGPNSTTFVIPGETPTFKTSVRSTAHGLSAAFGKAGAVLGTTAMKGMLDKHGVGYVMTICGCLSLGGFFWTALLIPRYTSLDVEAADRTEESHCGTTRPVETLHFSAEQQCKSPNNRAVEAATPDSAS